MENRKKISQTLKKILEYLWLVLAIVSLGIAAREVYLTGFKDALPFIVFIFIALFFFFSRRNQRIKQDKNA